LLERNKKRWPKNVDSCLRCGIDSSEVTYASRGLCTPCHGQAVKAGTVRQYAVVRRGGNAGVSDAYRKHLDRRKHNKELYYCVSHLGATEVGHRLTISSKAVGHWMKSGAPEEYSAQLAALYSWIREETREAERGRRAGSVAVAENTLHQTAWEMRECILEEA